MLNIAKREMADGFAKVWTHNGLAFALDDVHKQFACDFANVVITSFIDQQQKAALALKLAQEEAAKAKIVSTEVD
jgi:hypothetical protein